MYQAEAMWINFQGSYPMDVQVAAGRIDALTGASGSNELVADSQNLVVPDQPWLDGFSTGKGLIRQFVAMPLEADFSVEEQLTGAGHHGGLQNVPCPDRAAIALSGLGQRDRGLCVV